MPKQWGADDARLTGARKEQGAVAPRKESEAVPENAPQNIAWHLSRMAAAQPERVALKIPRGRKSGRINYLELTFRELEAEVDAWCARLASRAKPFAGSERVPRHEPTDPGQKEEAATRWEGVRTLVMLRQGLPLIAAVFALFKLGAVPIVIDPGMGLENFLRCVARSRPTALVGIPLAQVVSRVFWRKFRSVQWRVWASSGLTGRVQTTCAANAVRSPRLTHSASAGAGQIEQSAPAAILFTSGSTGAPKGVCYTHGMFEAQLGLIRAHYGIAAGEVDLPMLPVFALFNPALGMTTIVPEIDPRRPAQVDPAKIVQAIVQEGVTNSFGSPTLWLKIKRHCVARGIQLPSLRRVLCAGAPVPAELWEDTERWLPNGQLHSPYGATEALPICSVSSEGMGALRRGGSVRDRDALPNETDCDCRGACVGKPLPGITVKIVEIVDGPIATLADARELPRGQIGEILVGGLNVTQDYDGLPEATACAKVEVADLSIWRAPVGRTSLATSEGAEPDTPPTMDDRSATNERDGDRVLRTASGHAPNNKSPRLLHRMGDCGYLDEEGRLWFCGRVAERVQTTSSEASDGLGGSERGGLAGRTLYTEPCEQVFRAHRQVARCALIGLRASDGQASVGTQSATTLQTPALVVQPRSPKITTAEKAALARELRQLALAHAHTAQIERFYFHPDFPVDVRHNAKIHRLTLAHWAETAQAFCP